MIEFITNCRKELEEDKSNLESLPEDVRALAKIGHERVESMVKVLELQNEILHVMGLVITNSHDLIDKDPEKVKEVLGDSIERIKQLKRFFNKETLN